MQLTSELDLSQRVSQPTRQHTVLSLFNNEKMQFSNRFTNLGKLEIGIGGEYFEEMNLYRTVVLLLEYF